MVKRPLAHLDPEEARDFTDESLAWLLAEIWSDPYVRAELYGSRDFISERIRYFVARGYFTARERQGILRTLFASNFDIGRRVKRARSRMQAVAESA